MSVDFVELNKGPVVVIDNEIGKDKNINDIISKIEDKGLPILKYTNISKADREIGNIGFLNFIILDWRLDPSEAPLGVSIGDELKEHLIKKKIVFINKLKSVCFSPVFIFTNISTEGIEEEIEKPLKENNLLYSDNGKNFIFIRNKQEILKNLFDDVTKWIVENTHIYLSKIWLNQFLKNSNEIFWSLYEKNSNWPNVFYKSFEEDGENPISGLNDILFRVVRAKTNLNNIDDKVLKRAIRDSNIDEIKSLYSKIMYLTENIDDIKPGDIYKDGRKYYINIRPECDTTKRENIEDIDIYLIVGTKISDAKVEKEFYNKKYGLIPKPICHILPFLDGKNFIWFKFKNFEIKKYSEMKSKKICRLLPPFITHFQHQYSSFLGRYGIPKVPQEVYDEIFSKLKEGSENA
ncbi:MAG: hypothetical protein KAW92_06960 [Candidatus Cloacimonetes bacterium]|nr:hypothetical protein [Candidatus Cloacimonadota bacterium]